MEWAMDIDFNLDCNLNCNLNCKRWQRWLVAWPVRQGLSVGLLLSFLLSLLPGLLLSVLLIQSANAQRLPAARWANLASPVFEQVGAEQGLPHSGATSVMQDSDGFIWAGTQAGLARWDGYQFKVYKHQGNDRFSLPHNFVQTIFLDARGQLWVGTNGGGLARYDRQQDRFERYLLALDGVSRHTVFSIENDGAGGLWLGLREGLIHLGADGKQLGYYRHRSNQAHSLPDDMVRALVRDKHGKLWVGTQNGLVYFDAASKTFVTPSRLKKPIRQIVAMMMGSDGRIWIGTDGYGAMVFQPGTGQLELISTTPPGSVANAHARINSIHAINAQQVWLGSIGEGIYAVDSQSLRVRMIRRNPNISSSLSHNSVWSMVRERSGLIWVAHERGLSRFRDQDAILTIAGIADATVGDFDVTSIWQLQDASILLGGASAVGQIAADTQQLKMLALRNAKGEKVFQTSPIRAIAQSGPDSIFVGGDRALYRMNARRQAVRVALGELEKSLDAVNALWLDKNQLWLGSGTGLIRYDLASDKASWAAGSEGLRGRGISAIAAGRANRLWISTRDSGLYRYDSVTHTLQNYRNDAHDASSISCNSTSSILNDSRGWLWVACLGGGVNLVRQAEAAGPLKFERISIGLPSDIVNKVLEDNQGNIWLSTDEGLARIDSRTLLVQTFQRADGVASNGFLINSGIKTAQGELIFGSGSSVTVVRPERLQDLNYSVPVVLTSVQVNGKTLVSSQFNQPNRAEKVLTLPPGSHSLAIGFAALDYSAPERNRYTWQLQGYDANWIEPPATQRQASYANLPPGDYQLRLRGSNHRGVWSTQEQVLTIRVMAAWYQTTWFYFLMVLLVASALAGVVHVRTRILRQSQRDLEAQVDERTTQLYYKQKELVSANRELQEFNSALNDANRNLATSVDTLRQLGDIGREITASLDQEMVFAALYQYVGGLLDAPHLTIYRINAQGDTLEQVFGREDDMELPAAHIDVNSPTSHAAWAARERREWVEDRHHTKGDPSHISGTRYMLSIMFAPLIVDDKVLGVMSVQSNHANAYGEREKLIFRTICSYGAIALANAEAILALRQAQAQLVQQEKLVSLGTLTAGIAHEINNPSNFAHVGAYNLRTDLHELHEFLLHLAGDEATPEFLAALRQRFDKLNQSLETISEGTVRIRNLVRDLRTFSRLDEADWRVVALADSLRATVNLVRTQYLNQLEIRFEPEADPEIECWPAQINQVFMNLIVNACHAIITRPPELCANVPGVLLISSRLEGEFLLFEFRDNGIGIAPDALEKIFDPFYTTKTVGEGMGMGLSISFGIMVKHRGSLSVSSVLGQGACFTVSLPLRVGAGG
jgi:signal transduction histidine kinase/ligand-binding sensor domain-containing protein